MDATLSYGLPRVNQSGTLLEGIALWGERKPLLTQEALIERALDKGVDVVGGIPHFERTMAAERGLHGRVTGSHLACGANDESGRHAPVF
jgi:hypothetical protein